MLRALLLNNVPAPYFGPLFEKIGAESGWLLTVCYSSDWNKDVGWGEKSQAESPSHGVIILDRQNPALKSWFGSSFAAAAALLKLLLVEKPDYLICCGYTLAPQTTALLWAMMTATPFAVMGDANYFNDTAVGMKRLVKTAWLRLLVSKAAALIAVGSASRMFWESYGAGADKIFESGLVVDNDFFATECERRKDDVAQLRAQLGLTGKIVFLFVGRLVRRKNVDLIIRAAQMLNNDQVAVVIAGSGEEREALEKLAGADPSLLRPLSQRIIFAGNVSPADLPLYYALSDAFVLPASQEPWGLVINEAMASGLAIIAHHHCGAAIDLVADDNGFALETFSVEELSEAMGTIAGDRARLGSMQSRSREKIKSWSIDAAARGIIQAVEISVKK